MNQKALVSACLCGDKCRYDSKGLKIIPKIKKLKNIFKVCPEKLGGLPVPRKKSFIVNGNGRAVLQGCAKVVDEKGKDVTANFLKGAQKVLNLVQKNGIRKAIMKARSPSCGKDGVTFALLKLNKIKIEIVD
ncbi:MAG: DUF523 domain-containing protein [Elusimicrobia bacterium]|nr:DUF523 domain-containing protein [Elusimicrobiota bacterium]MBU2615293.1 DUF523 domain-containing protein [Elusimicrobiota bacterium]